MNHTVSVDAGNGGTNAAIATKGGYKSTYFPSIRAVVRGESLGIGDFDMEYQYLDWFGRRFVVGDDVLRVKRSSLERHMGVGRSGNEFQQFLVAAAIARLGVKSGEVNLTMFTPPGVFKDMRPKILEGFTDNNGEVEIKLKGKKAYKWRYDSVTVLPEGIGAAMCFILDQDGNAVDDSVLDGDVIIMDIGALTLDVVQLHEGNFAAEELDTATWENAGMNERIREPMLHQIKRLGNDFDLTTVDDIDLALRIGFLKGDYVLRVAGHEVNLLPMLTDVSNAYAEWIANTIVDSKLRGFRGVTAVILVGGGAVLVRDRLTHWYGNKIVEPSRYASARKIHPVDFNCVGGLRYALAMQREGGA